MDKMSATDCLKNSDRLFTKLAENVAAAFHTYNSGSPEKFPEEDSMPGTVSEPLQKPRRDVGLCSHPNYDPLLDLRQSAAYLALSEDSMGDLARNRQIAVVRSTKNGKMRFRLSVLNAWVKSHEIKARPDGKPDRGELAT